MKRIKNFIYFIISKIISYILKYTFPRIIIYSIVEYIMINFKYFRPFIKEYFKQIVSRFIINYVDLDRIKFSGNSYDRRKQKRRLKRHVEYTLNFISYNY